MLFLRKNGPRKMTQPLFSVFHDETFVVSKAHPKAIKEDPDGENKTLMEDGDQ